MTEANIMIVEDSTIIALDIKQSLEDFGYNVISTLSSGKELLQELTLSIPDLILLDIKIQGKLDGIQTAEEVKTRYGIPVIYLTSYSDKELLDRARLTDPFGYIVKPFQERELYSTIEMALYRNQLEQKTREHEALYRTLVEVAPEIIMREITEERQTLLQLQETKELLEGILNSIPDVISVLAPDLKILHYNMTGYELFGLTQDQVIGKECYTIFGKDKYCENCAARRAKETKSLCTVEEYIPDLDMYFLTHVNPILDEEGQVKLLIEQHHDITIEKQINLALQKSEAKYRSLFSNMTDGFSYNKIILDEKGEPIDFFILEVNKAFEEQMGVARKEVVGRRATEVMPYIIETSAIQLAGQVALTGEPLRILGKYSPHLKRWFSYLIFSPQKGYLATIITDITEQKKVERRVQEEIRKASLLHQKMLPTHFPQDNKITFSAHYQPAQDLGGDFYNILKIKNQMLIYLIDVSGHGLDGAMLNIFIRDTINSYLLNIPRDQTISPKEILYDLREKYVQEDFPEEYFICAWVGVLNLDTMELVYSNAGIQISPLMISFTGNMDILRCKGLPITSVIDEELIVYENKMIQIEQGSKLVYTTDGLIEEMVDGQMYGEERLRQVVMEHSILPTDLMIRAINYDFWKFNRSLQGTDDITYLVMQYNFLVIDELDMDFSSDFGMLPQIQIKIRQFIEQYSTMSDQIIMGLHEMIINAIEHGNKQDKRKKVKISIQVKEEYIRIDITDEGKGFNWRERINRGMNLDSDNERGRGIQLTDLCFEDVSYNRRGNSVALLKVRHGN